MKPFDLLNTILLTRTKTLVNNLIMSNFQWKSNLEHKLHIFETVILIVNWKDYKSRRRFYTKNFTYTNHEKILRTRNCHRKIIKNLLPEKRKETKPNKPNNHDLYRDSTRFPCKLFWFGSCIRLCGNVGKMKTPSTW